MEKSSRSYICKAKGGKLTCSVVQSTTKTHVRPAGHLSGLTPDQLSKLNDYVNNDILKEFSGANPHILQPNSLTRNHPVKSSGKCPFGYDQQTSNKVNAQTIIYGTSAEKVPDLINEISLGMRKPLVMSHNLPTFKINQNSVRTGTYRIKTPGIYVFTSNVVFDANYTKAGANRADLPLNGHWFAAISVECDGPVKFCGNGYKLSQSTNDMINDLPGAFSLILLGNSMFSGAFFATGNAIFPDSSSNYIPAHNVKITGLKFGSCNHFGIRGSNNNNIRVTYCTFQDEQIGPISMQSPNGFTIDHCLFEGADEPVRVLNDQTTDFTLQNILAFLDSLSVPGAATYLANLNIYVAANPARFIKTQVITSAMYGIAISAGITPAFEFPVGTVEDEIARGLAGFPGYTPPGTNIVITNCCFNNFISDPVEGVTIGTNIPRTTRETEVPLFPGLIVPTSIQWADAFDSGGSFAPNDFIKALAFVMAFLYPTLPPFITNVLPANALTVFNAILNDDGPTFFSNVSPIVGAGADFTHLKGLFGIRLIGLDGVKINNITMNKFNIKGARGIDPETLPGYQLLTNPQPIKRYTGGDLWFMAVETCQNISINKIYLKHAITDFGYCFGIHLAVDDSNVTVQNVVISYMSAPNTVESATTDTGDVFGITVEDNTGPILIKNAVIKNLTAGGEIIPFASASPTINLVNAVYYA
jgi:hypothetical protein